MLVFITHYSEVLLMFAMFRAFFSMLTSLFSAGQRLANAADQGAAFVEGEAAGFNERTSLARAQELKKLRSQYNVEDFELAAQEALAARNLDRKNEELVRDAKAGKKQDAA